MRSESVSDGFRNVGEGGVECATVAVDGGRCGREGKSGWGRLKTKKWLPRAMWHGTRGPWLVKSQAHPKTISLASPAYTPLTMGRWSVRCCLLSLYVSPSPFSCAPSLRLLPVDLSSTASRKATLTLLLAVEKRIALQCKQMQNYLFKYKYLSRTNLGHRTFAKRKQTEKWS